MLRIAICDDELSMLEFLSNTVQTEMKNYNMLYSIDKFENGALFLDEHRKNNYEVIFLDIYMPDLQGFDVAKEIRHMSENVFIIFITMKDELVYDSFDYRPFNFIRKGDLTKNSTRELLRENLISVLNKLMCHMKQNNVLDLQLGRNEIKRITLRDIIYIKSDKHYLQYMLTDGTENVITREKIGEKEQELADYNFIRISKKLIINMRHTLRIDTVNNEAVLTNGEKLDIARTLLNTVNEKYKQYMRTLT